MPVTFYPSNPATTPGSSFGAHASDSLPTSSEFLQKVSNSDSRRCKGIFQSSLGGGVVPGHSSIPSQGDDAKLYGPSHPSEPFVVNPSDHGFVRGVMLAYNQHQHLVLRPDDVWLAILTQLSFYVNAHAEELRHIFVSHEGKKTLTVYIRGSTPYDIPIEGFAAQMSSLMGKEIKDETFKDWLLPVFSTTKEDDMIAATITMMSSMKEYFAYRAVLVCGIPKVTLMGEKEDWELLLGRIDRLKEFGEEPEEWATILRPVLERFLKAFTDNPHGKWNRTFWGRVATLENEGSGSTLWTGWITAFCFWDVKGKKMSTKRKPKAGEGSLQLDGAKYHTVDPNGIAPGFCGVDLLIVDGGGNKIDSYLMAGSVGILATKDGSPHKVQPVTGWWLYEKKKATGVEATSD